MSHTPLSGATITRCHAPSLAGLCAGVAGIGEEYLKCLIDVRLDNGRVSAEVCFR
jgi:hypothetical protein